MRRGNGQGPFRALSATLVKLNWEVCNRICFLRSLARSNPSFRHAIDGCPVLKIDIRCQAVTHLVCETHTFATMDETRQTTAFTPRADLRPADTPKLPATDKKLAQYLEDLRQQDGITLPGNDQTSPSKRRKSPGHDCVKLLSILCFTDELALVNALGQFRLQSPRHDNNDDRLNRLLDSLRIAFNSPTKNSTRRSPRHHQEQVAPSSERHVHEHMHVTSMGPPTVPLIAQQTPTSPWSLPKIKSPHFDEMPDPPSPTLSIKRNAAIPSLSLVAPYPQLPQEAPPLELDLARSTSHVTSVNTSFARTSANTSFWSNAQNSQEPVSPATSIASISYMDGANETVNARCTPSSSNCWGTQPASSVFDRLDTSGQPTSTETKWGSSIPDEDLPDNTETPCKRPRLDSGVRQARQLASAEGGLDQPPQDPTTPPPAPPTKEKPASEDLSKDSPDKRPGEHVRVRNIPIDGMACGQSMSGRLPDLPFELQWESARLMQACEITAEILEAKWPYPRSFPTLQHVAEAIAPPGYQFKLKNAYERCSFHAKIRWRDPKENDRPLFKLDLLPPSYENHNSWQRKYGSHRFLFVEVESLDKPPTKLQFGSQKEHVAAWFLEMLSEPQKLLGRTWLQFHAQPKKSNKKSLNPENRTAGMQFIFAAISSDDHQLHPLGLRDIVGWTIPFAWNFDQSWCKAGSRLDLHASRPVSIMTLKPDQVAWTDDLRATEDPPDEQFNDPSFGSEHAANSVYKRDTVMSDGCSVAHPYLFQQIKKRYGLDYVPSVAQFRFAMAKGLVSMIKVDYNIPFDPNVRPEGPLIWIHPSQLKVLPGRNTEPEHYDEHYWTFQVLKASHPTPPSLLYLDFLPILKDRHVPVSVIEKVALQSASAETEAFLLALKDRQTLREWIHRENASWEELRRDGGITTLAGFPKARLERAVHMLQAGFEPSEFKPLAEDVLCASKSLFDRKKKFFRIRLDNSTNVLGIADSTGTLAPGEIYHAPSQPFTNPITGMLCRCLEGEVIIGRSPAGRPSDIQKARAVYRPELSHLYDVVVFSAKGPRPLADKLAGGDYDGDIFWLCWEPELVGPFSNAPAPQHPPEPESLGIQVDKKKLRDIMTDPDDEAQIREFVQMTTANRMKPSLLGIVTRTLERVVSLEGPHTPRAKAVMNLKDLIMDSDKNGRTFSFQAWGEFKKLHNLMGLPTPAHFEFTTAGYDGQAVETDFERKNPDNIIDRVYFWILGDTFDDAMGKAQMALNGATPDDAHLSLLYEQMRTDAEVEQAEGKPGFSTELQKLKEQLQRVRESWNQAMGRRSALQGKDRVIAWDAAVLSCREQFDAILPAGDVSAERMREWLRKSAFDLSTWDKLRASAMARLLTAKDHRMWFQIAAGEMCYIKARESQGSLLLTLPAYLALKPRKRKAAPGGGGNEDAGAESDYGEFELADVEGGMDVGLDP